jgi:hypothetical protein
LLFDKEIREYFKIRREVNMKGFFRKFFGARSKPMVGPASVEAQAHQAGLAPPPPVEQAQQILASNHQEMEIATLSSLILDLKTPPSPIGIMTLGYLTTVGVPAILLFFHQEPWAIFSALVLFFAWGVRYVPPVNCALLYDINGRTEIGFHEGPVWIPWFIFGRLKMFPVDRFFARLPQDDAWTADKVHVVHKSSIQFCISPVPRKGFWVNLMWWWHVKRETETFEDFSDMGVDLGEGLNNFITNWDVESARAAAIDRIMDIIREKVNSIRFDSIYNFDAGTALLQEKRSLSKEIKELIAQDMEIRGVGFFITLYNLSDIDPHPDMAHALEWKTKAAWQAQGDVNAQNVYYDGTLANSKKLTENPVVGETAIKIAQLKVAEDAARSGLVGEDIFTKIARSFSELFKPVNQKKISEK